MEKKRSVGVTILGWLFIIVGIFGLLTYLLIFIKAMSFKAEGVNKISYYWGFLSYILTIIGGIYVLKLKEWARRLMLILCFIGMLLHVLESPSILKKADFDLKKQEIVEKYKPEYQEEVLKHMGYARKALPYLMYLMLVVTTGLYLFPIVFFTRPKVKQQFTGAES